MNPASSERRRLVLRLLACACMLAAATVAKATVQPGANNASALAAQIDQQIDQPRFAAASWGISVVSLDSGRTLYAHRADQLMQPASTAKLFTAALALSTLGGAYQIPTRVLASEPVHDGRLNGPIVLYGMGDPTLGTTSSVDWAAQLADQMYQRGVRLVHGDLMADDSYFTGPTYGSGWEAGDLQSWFAVPSSALSVEENIVDLTLAPASAAGLAASLSMDPVDAGLSLRGQITTTLSRDAADINLYRAPGDTTLYAFGTVPAKTPPQHFKLSLPDPALLAGEQLRKALIDRGIAVSGQVQALHWPQDDAALISRAQALAEVRSPPLMEILQRGLKRSQNLYLQNLFLSVGAQQQSAQAATDIVPFASTQQWSVKTLQHLLADIGMPPSSSLIDEGTGLSRRDLVTPTAMVRLLTYLSAQPYAAQLRDALPIAGVDGTLAGQLRHTAAENNVHAKTGSMTYVHCLVGYVTSAAGERLAFAIMLNNYEPPADGPSAGADVDAIALLLARFQGRH
jgi:D-alanyl-D-alanine carboxypeptidase/D-alanyl-D-alanine-endopeptidase (penicillin-binding protein 4)